MVLEALAAVSLAGSIVEFVEFTTKVISKGRQYHSSSTGSLDEDIKLQAFGDNLQRLSKNLTASLESFASSKLTKEEKALKKVAVSCEQTGRELGIAIDSLKINETGTRWKSFRHALKSEWNKEQIDTTLQKLRLAREDLVIHLLVVLK